MQKHFIALTGPSRSGKDSVARELAAYLPGTWIVTHPGDYFKKIVHQIVGRHFSDEEKDMTFNELNGFSPRDAYIYIADFEEKFHPIAWMKMIFEAYAGSNVGIIITSIKHQQQWDDLKQYAFVEHGMKGHLIEVDRPGYVYSDTRSAIEDHNKFKIENTGELDDLQLATERAANVISKSW